MFSVNNIGVAMYFINEAWKQITDKYPSKKLVFWGIGSIFNSFIEHYTDWWKYTVALVDRSPEKCGKFYEYDNHKIRIISENDFLKMNCKEILLIISCADVEGVVTQLSSIDRFSELECCYSHFIERATMDEEEKTRIYPESFRISKERQIPKIIHYCWFGKNPIPEKNLKWMESWKRFCPDYEIIEWNEDNYDVFKNEFMAGAYRTRKWAYVSDYARLDVVYQYGGIYLDTDVELVRPLDDLLYQRAFAGVDRTLRLSLGLGFGAEPKADAIKDMLSIYTNRKFNENQMISAPRTMEKYFRTKGFIQDGNLQIIENGVTVYPEKVLSAKDFTTGMIELGIHTYAIHHYDGSWENKEKHDKMRYVQQLYAALVANGYRLEIANKQ